VAVIIIIAGLYFLTKPPPPEEEIQAYTAFFYLDQNHTDTDFPINLITGEQGVLIISIACYEQRTTEYSCKISLESETTSDEYTDIYSNTWGQTFQLGPKYSVYRNVTLNHDEIFEDFFEFEIVQPGFFNLEMTLYNATNEAPLILTFWITVDCKGTPLVELFGATDCTNCPRAEAALVDIDSEEDITFITYVTDVAGLPGDISHARELEYADDILGYPFSTGHPWAVFAGGPNNELGAGPDVKERYLSQLNDTYLEPMNIMIEGHLNHYGPTLRTNIDVYNYEDTSEQLYIEIFLVEEASRWTNFWGEPIPNAFVDLLVNETTTILGQGVASYPVDWTGTDVLSYSDMRFENVALVVVVWHDGEQVTSAVISA
jgi:hypothetical protein